MKPSKIHEAIIKKFVEKNKKERALVLQTKGFAVNVSKAVISEREERKEWREMLSVVKPDIYEIITEENIVVAFEVEHSNPLSKVKLFKYVNLWFSLDCEGWSLSLMKLNCTDMTLCEVPLRTLWYLGLEEDCKQRSQ